MGFTPLRISTIKPNKDLTFDLFINFKERFLKYVNNGKKLDKSLYAKLKVQKIARFYIDDKDEIKYQHFLDEILNETLNDDTINVLEKSKVVEGAASTAVERMQDDPGNKTSYKMTESAAKSLRQIVSENPGALKEIFGRTASEAGDVVIKHGLNVSALSCKLAEHEKLNSSEIDDLATAALIHGIGITKLQKSTQDLFTVPLKNFTNEQLVEWRTYPSLSAKMLEGKEWINANVIKLIMNQEERLSGSGPNKVTKLGKTELILSMVHIYDKLIIAEKMTPIEAIKNLQIDEMGNYPLELITNFKNVLKVQGILDLDA